MVVAVSAPIHGAIPRNFTLTATPYTAGYPAVVVETDLGPVLHIRNLSPGILYKLCATASLPDGRVVPVVESQYGMRYISGSEPTAPLSIALATATGPTTAHVAMSVSGPPPSKYVVYFAAADRVVPSVRGNCVEPSECRVEGLVSDTTYTIVAYGMMANGRVVPAKGIASVTTPTDGSEGTQPSPIISSASRRGTGGSVLINWLGPSPRPKKYIVFLSPLSGGAATKQTCLALNSSITCPFSGLSPSSEYLVSSVLLCPPPCV